MYIATPLAILFLVITAAWTGIFAIAFARQKPVQQRNRLADCFWIGVPSVCMAAAIVLLSQNHTKCVLAPENEAHEHAHASVAEHKRECILDSQTQRIAAHPSVTSPTGGNAESFDTARRPTLQR
jgi:hypothetical protein